MSTLSTTNLKNPSSGSNNIVLASDGSATIATLSSTTITGTTIQGTIKSGTAVASTSGTSIDFTSIPSWVKRITIVFDQVSLTGTDNLLVRIGTSGGLETTGYAGASSACATTVNTDSSTVGYVLTAGVAASSICGCMILTNITGNTWISTHTVGRSDAASTRYGGGTKSLSGTLNQLRILPSGANTFDAGSINILYEG
jgi:hypothetical protein